MSDPVGRSTKNLLRNGCLNYFFGVFVDVLKARCHQLVGCFCQSFKALGVLCTGIPERLSLGGTLGT